MISPHEPLKPLISFLKGKVTRTSSLYIYLATFGFFDKTTTKGESAPTNVSVVSGVSCNT